MSKIDLQLLINAFYLEVFSGNKDNKVNVVYIFIGQFYPREEFLNLDVTKFHKRDISRILSCKSTLERGINYVGAYKSIDRNWYVTEKNSYTILHLGKLKDLGTI